MPRILHLAARGECEVVIERVFDAPRGLVFEAWTTPDLVKRWLGAFGGWSLAVCEIDLSPGGVFRHVWHGPGGTAMAMHGVYREVVVPERIVSVATFEDCHPGNETSTVTFVERVGGTIVTVVVLYDSQDVRDGMLATSMEKGLAAGCEKLADVLKALTEGGRR